MKGRVRREGDEIFSDTSSSCVKCGHHLVTKTVGTTSDFDEKGWFYPAQFVCQSAKCGHKWTEKIVAQQGNHFLQ